MNTHRNNINNCWLILPFCASTTATVRERTLRIIAAIPSAFMLFSSVAYDTVDCIPNRCGQTETETIETRDSSSTKSALSDQID
jgi:hypothetical protein